MTVVVVEEITVAVQAITARQEEWCSKQEHQHEQKNQQQRRQQRRQLKLRRQDKKTALAQCLLPIFGSPNQL